MESLPIRIIGDPVLRKRAEEVTEIESPMVELCQNMLDVMYAAPGIGLAAPQVGISKRFFVYDIGDGPDVLINPVLLESDGEWGFEEGCLSAPGQFFEIIRPKEIHVSGINLDGDEVDFEADELFSRLIQHELDHLDGVLLFDHLSDEDAKTARSELRASLMSAE